MADYFVKSGTGGADDGTSWADAAESLSALMAAQALTQADRVLCHNTHNAVYSTNTTITIEAGSILSVDGGDSTGASLSGTTVGNLYPGATESTNGNFFISLASTSGTNRSIYIYGMNFTTGTGISQNAAYQLLFAPGSASVPDSFTFTECAFYINSTGTAYVSIGNTANNARSAGYFNNCSFRFAVSSAATNINLQSGYFRFDGCKVHPSSGSPDYLFNNVPNVATIAEFSGCDWSNCDAVFGGAASNASYQLRFNNCVISTPTTGSTGEDQYSYVEFSACAPADGTNGADVLNYFKESALGVIEDSQTVYLTSGGAQGEQDDGTDTPYSLKMTPSAAVSAFYPLWSPWVYVLVGSTGSKTLTMKVAHTESAALTTSEIFMEVDYMGEPGLAGTQRVADSPQSVSEFDDDCPLLSGSLTRDLLSAGTSRTDTTEAWTGITSEKTHTLTATVSCDEVGYLRCRVGVAKQTTNPVYVDPKIGVA